MPKSLKEFKRFLCASLNHTYYHEIHEKVNRAMELFNAGDRWEAREELLKAVRFIEVMEDLIKPGKRICRVCGKTFIGRYPDVVCSEECFRQKYACIEVQDEIETDEEEDGWDCFR